ARAGLDHPAGVVQRRTNRGGWGAGHRIRHEQQWQPARDPVEDWRHVRRAAEHDHLQHRFDDHPVDVAGGGVVATYRVISIVPTVATMPGAGSPTVADEADVVLATNTASQFPDDMDRHSAGMCKID